MPPRKPGKTPKKPVKASTKRPKKPGLKPVVIGDVSLTRKSRKPGRLTDRYSNGRLRKAVLEEAKALRAFLAAERGKARRAGVPVKKKPRKSKQDAGFAKLEDAITEGVHPEDTEEKSGQEYYVLIAKLTQMAEREIYSTLMGSPPDVGIAA